MSLCLLAQAFFEVLWHRGLATSLCLPLPLAQTGTCVPTPGVSGLHFLDRFVGYDVGMCRWEGLRRTPALELSKRGT